MYRKLPLVLLISLLPLTSLFRFGAYESGDMQIHASKLMVFTAALNRGEMFPRWAPELNAGFGYPLFEFTYPLPYYLMSLIHVFGFGYIGTVKIFMALCFLLSGLFMYQWARCHFSETIAFIVALTYQFSPYHLIDLHFRVALGELLALAVLPLAFLSLYRFSRHLPWSLPWAAISLACLILSHPAIAVAGLPLVLVYSTFVLATHPLLPLALSLLLSAFYWLPVLAESRFTLRSVLPHTVVFPKLTHLITSPYKFGLLYQGPSGQLAFPVGLLPVFSLLVICWLVMRKPSRLLSFPLLSFSLSFSCLYLFLLLPASALVWRLPFLSDFQFAWRLLGPLIFTGSVLVGCLLTWLKPRLINRYILPLVVLSIAATTPNWGARTLLHSVTDTTLRLGLPLLTHWSEGLEAVPRWVDPNHPWIATQPASRLQIITGQSSVVPTNITTLSRTYQINNQTTTVFQENTYYFPGWQLTANDTFLSFNYPRGIITFMLPPGSFQVNLQFRNTPIRTTAEIATLTGLSITSLLFFRPRPFA